MRRVPRKGRSDAKRRVVDNTTKHFDSMKCAKLYENFERREYAFAYTECETLVEGHKISHKVLSLVFYMC